MRKIYLIVLILVFLISCAHEARKPAQDMVAAPLPLEAGLRMEIDQFQELIEEALVWRAKSLEFSNIHKEEFKKRNLSHEEMLTLYESAKHYLFLREKILAMAHRYEKMTEEDMAVEYSPGTGTSLDISAESFKIDPTDKEGRDFLIRSKISLSAALVLYDNYMISVFPYLKNKKTRKMLNGDIPGFSSELDRITDNFFDLKSRNKIIRGIALFKKDLEFKNKNQIETDQYERYLEMLSLQSPFYAFISGKHTGIEGPGKFRAYFDRIFDRVSFMNEAFTFITSKIFGNTLGIVAFREGLLSKLSSEEKREIVSQLKPLDIMLEKTPFRLTDQFIPGHYGHVAIWIGDESDLRALDLWDHPVVKKYHNEILSGKRIVEALRPGVQINSLDHFLNIDDLLILRDTHLTHEQKREYIIRAFEQIGKEYDFNFDVETDSKIVCSEIVYVVFHDIDWPVKKTLGRYTISPDNVATKAFDENDRKILEPILMYRSGVREKSALGPEIRDVLNVNPKIED